MKFDLTSKNFNVTKELSPKLDASLNRLRHALNSFPKIEKPAEIILEKRLRSEEYKAKITYQNIQFQLRMLDHPQNKPFTKQQMMQGTKF